MHRLITTATFVFLTTTANAQNVGTDGKYFTYNGTRYMTQGAESVSAPGQTGKITGKGLLGPLFKNGFSHFGHTRSGGASAGTEFLVDGSIVASGNANVSLAAGDRVDLGVDADATIDSSKRYKGLFVKVNDWSGVIDELNALAANQPDGSNIFSKDFRIIDSVLYVTGYAENTLVTLSGEITLDVDAGQDLVVIGTVNGDGTKSDSLVLSDGSTIAYAMRHLCWQNGKVVDTAADVLGKPRPKSCKTYK